MRTILVSGASGIVGYGILKSLREIKDIKLIGTTIYEDSIAPVFSDIVKIVPKTCEDNYIESLIKIIQKYNVDMIIPSIEADMFKWNDERKIIKETGCIPLLNNSNLINLCKDKWLFYQELSKHNKNYVIPTYMSVPDNIKYPVILKPRRGYASQGMVIINNEEELAIHKSKIGDTHILQPLIGSLDSEYTTSTFFDTDSNLKAYMTLRRKLSKQGYTETAETVDIHNIKEVLTNLANIFKPTGPTNFQFRLENNELKLLEINPRISSATSIRAAFGYNESKMSIDYFLDKKEILQPELKKGKAIRYIEDYIEYDRNNI